MLTFVQIAVALIISLFAGLLAFRLGMALYD